MKYAIIGGTGVYSVDGTLRSESLDTPYGTVDVEILSKEGKEIVFLPRHGKRHDLPPHMINYKANMMALKTMGVTHILATCAVGSCDENYAPGHIVVLKDFLDFTKDRDLTFHDGSGGVKHTDMSDPYCKNLRDHVKAEAESMGLSLSGQAVYVCTQGPRFETASEIKFYRSIGGQVVGMTNVPEVVLAKELGMCYAACGIVTNWCTGFESQISVHDIQNAVGENKSLLTRLFINVFSNQLQTDKCHCTSAVMAL
ncbi:S-methyl-5'-thioinosine phosphorylase [Fusibacter sp. JL216-2]|uniref:S-methyl-5'-thioinosine phosphorylase n=1 Tax=Fusibacter sp. JL216-2 TaxID=3071453 RepID=UPI003D3412FB